MKSLLLLSLLSSFLAASGCDSPQPTVPGQVRMATVQLGKQQFDLEIADTPAARERGLMYRQSMPSDRGMLFVFDYPEVLRFWMKNTYIPLDIIYLDAAGQVVTIRQMKPLDTSTVSSEREAKYAIEINAGMAEKAGVHVGDKVALPAK